MAKEIYIHAGAHRTGTSSFQMCLAVNAPALAAAGYDLAYPTRDDIPGRGLALRLPRPRDIRQDKPLRPFVQKVRRELAEISPGSSRTLILSEENIPGPMRNFYDGQFYPAAPGRLAALRRALPVPTTHCLFVIRPYAPIFISAYRKRSEDNPSRPFADLAPVLAGITGSWAALVQALQNRLQPQRLTVLDYGARGSSADLLRRLVPGLEQTELAEPAKTVNLSATDAGLIALQKRYAAGETLPRTEWQQVIADHAGDKTDHGFTRFTEDQARALKDKYSADLDSIAAMEGVTLIA